MDTSTFQDTLKAYLTEGYDTNHMSAVPEIPIVIKIYRRIWWLTVSKTADRPNKMCNEDLEAAHTILRDSTTESWEVSVECSFLKPDWLLSMRHFYVIKGRDLIENNSPICFL